MWSWRFGAVLLPWLVIASIFYTGITKYYQASEIIVKYPADMAEIRATASVNDRRIFVVERAIVDFSSKLERMESSVDKIMYSVGRMSRNREN
jgi:hypothetical protein